MEIQSKCLIKCNSVIKIKLRQYLMLEKLNHCIFRVVSQIQDYHTSFLNNTSTDNGESHFKWLKNYIQSIIKTHLENTILYN